MEYLQQLLQRYREGNATEQERIQLLQLLEEKETDLLQVLEQEFATELTEAPVLPAERAARVLQQIHQRMPVAAATAVVAPGSGKMIRRVAGWAAAAAVIVCICLYALQPQQPHNNTTTVAAVVPAAVKPTIQPVSNTSRQPEAICLPDSSVAVLYPGSTLSYLPAFDSLHRDLYLQGEALFKVTKDARRPFTVYAEGIATTALGTEFSVSTQYKKLRVRLITGKVVVRSTEKLAGAKDVYLKPGEECWITRNSTEALVQAFTGGAAQKLKPVTSTAPAAVPAMALEFTKAPLQHVFKQIGALFHVNIDCRDVRLSHLSFTGNILPTDSLQVVLTIICNTNDLAFTQQENNIKITHLK